MNTITTAEELDALREAGIASYYLFGRSADLILAWETEGGDLVGIRPWSEDDSDASNATRETWAVPVADLDRNDGGEILPLRLLWHDGQPDLTDAALIEEASRRGMSVMDAAEAARLRGVEAESETWHRAYDVDKAFRARVEKLADEWARLGGPKTALDLPIHLLYVNDLRAPSHCTAAGCRRPTAAQLDADGI